MADQPKFLFDSDFQNAILGTLAHSTSFLRRFRETIKPEYFEADEQWLLCSILFDFYDDQGIAPSKFLPTTRLTRREKGVPLPAARAIDDDDGSLPS